MPERPTNPDPARPDESDLLAYVEGERLAPEVADAIARAIDANPALAGKLRDMQSDRAALASIADEPCPAFVLESVQAALESRFERQMLLELEAGPLVDSVPPRTIVSPVRRSILDAFLGDRTGRRLAAAAAILIVAGTGTWITTNVVLRSSDPTSPIGPIASSGNVPEELSMAMRAEEPDPELGAATTVASGESALDTAVPETEPTRIAMTDPEADLPPAAIDAAAAVRLAREHRLVIRVRALDTGRAMARLSQISDRLARPGSGVTAWRLETEVPQSVHTALTSERESPSRVPYAPAESRPVLATSDRGFAESVPSILVRPALPPMPPVVREPMDGLFLVQSRLDSQALGAILATLTEGTNQQARFEALADPLPDTVPVVNPAAVLWWTQPPANWAPWASVPVVVERAR